MSDWQVGDLAVCVELNPQSPCSLGNLQVGQAYRVLEVAQEHYGTTLLIDGARSGHFTGHYRAFRFRKIRPDKHEACEDEFVTLLKRAPLEVVHG